MNAVLMAEQSRAIEGTAVPRRRHAPRRSWWLPALLVTALMAGLTGVLVHNEMQTYHRYDQAKQSFEATSSQLGVARTDLAALLRELDVRNGQISQTTAGLGIDLGQLQNAETALAQSQGQVSTQSASINVLQTCLGGVTQALNSLSVGDQRTAISALDKVSASCQSAVVTNG